MTYQFTTYPSGAVMCCYRLESGGSINVVNRDAGLSIAERREMAQKEVDRILMMTATDNVIESVGNSVDVVV